MNINGYDFMEVIKEDYSILFEQLQINDNDILAKTKIDVKNVEKIYNRLTNLVASLNNLPKKFDSIADKIIISNEKLAKANEKYAKAMVWLTGGLVFVGILQVLIFLFRASK